MTPSSFRQWLSSSTLFIRFLFVHTHFRAHIFFHSWIDHLVWAFNSSWTSCSLGSSMFFGYDIFNFLFWLFQFLVYSNLKKYCRNWSTKIKILLNYLLSNLSSFFSFCNVAIFYHTFQLLFGFFHLSHCTLLFPGFSFTYFFNWPNVYFFMSFTKFVD